jgi:hypothetical protein
MATREQLEAALIKADAAGNTADAKMLADALRAMSKPIQLQGKVTPMADSAPRGVSANIESRLPKPTARQGNVVGDFLGATAATANGIVNGIPIAGPMITNASDALVGLGSMIGGGDYQQTVDRQRANRQTVNNDFQAANIAGNIAGGIGSFAGLGATAAGAEALGLTGGLGRQVANSALSTQGINTLDNMVRGQAPIEATQNAVGGALLSGGIPIVSAVLRAGGKVVNDQIVTPIRTAFNQENEAIKRVGNAVASGQRSGQVMTQAQEAMAAKAGAPVINADRFGEATRRLARAASNVSPEAGAALKGFTEDRFYTQGKRAAGFVQRLMGGATDDLALQDALRSAAQKSNKVAYDAARSSPNASSIWNPRIQGLMQSPEFLSAVKSAEAAAKTDAALNGYKAVQSPFIFGADGTVSMKPGVTPNLDFWDIVQRELRKAREALGPRELTQASRYDQLRRQLLEDLDTAVPEFAKARSGAAAFFGAEDAIDIGRKAFSAGRNEVPELTRGFSKLTQAEKDAASVGYASEIIDRIRSTNDRTNVINSLFNDDSIRARNELVLGPTRARELEAYVKTEQILQQLKDAVGGNSTTTQQLIGAGILGAGTGLWTGDAGTGLNVATLAFLGRRAAAMAGKKVDERVMKMVADMLMSADPAMVQKAINSAAMSKQHMDALDALMRALNTGARGAALGTGAAMMEAN